MTIRKNPTLALGILAALLIVCSLVFVPSSGWARLLWSTTGYIGLGAVFVLAGLRLKDIGLSLNRFKSGLIHGSIVILVIAAVFTLVYLFDTATFQDTRYNHTLSEAFFAVLVLLPLKTVLFEEIAFRGILPALLLKLKKSQKFTMIASSLAFGLWHISSALTIESFKVGSVTVPGEFMLLPVVLITSLAGLFLYELRRRSGSLLAPILVHWFVNAFSIILAALSWR